MKKLFLNLSVLLFTTSVVSAQLTDNAKAPNVFTVTSPAGSGTIKQPLSGNYNIGTGQDYTKIADAITALNTNGVSGACIFYLRDAAYAESPMIINAITGASAANTITFKPYTGITPTITITATDGDAGFELRGADYISFDGSNDSKGRDMTIVMAGASSRTFQLYGGDGATNNTIKNCVIVGYSNTSTTNSGIRVYGADHNNNTFENNSISKHYYGIYLYGGSSSNKNTGNVVKDNVIGSGIAANYIRQYGIYAKYQTNLEISGNEMYNIIYSSLPYGIFIYYSDNVTISKNNIHDIAYTATGGYGGYGIYLYLDVVEGGSNITIKNNLIRHITGDSDAPNNIPTGIRVRGSSGTYGVNIYYNSIYLSPDTDYGLNYEDNNWAAAVIIDDGPTQIDMRDNILRTSLGKKTGCSNTTYGYAVYCKGSISPFSIINNNIYYTDNQDNNYVGLIGTDPTTGSKDLVGWQTYTSQDANSLNSDPLYLSTIGLHPSSGSSAFNAGTPIADITTDYEGTTRNATTPTIGAYEEALTEYEWTGTTDNDWNIAENWNVGAVPTAAINVTIPTGCANYPTINAPAACNNISFGSDATNTATLLDNRYLTVNGTATVERYFTGNDLDWHLVSSPLFDATANVFLNMYLQSFDPTASQGPPNYGYTEITDPLISLNAMQGYGLYSNLANTNTVNFVGSLNTGTYNFNLGYHAVNNPYGWNLTGNPYCSSIDWDLVTIPTNMSKEVHYIEAATGNNLSYVQGGVGEERNIPPMQGVFVSVSGPDVLTFDNTVRTHTGAGTFYKSEINDLLVLQATGENYLDKAYIYFNEQAMDEHDGIYDAYKRISLSNPELPQIFSITPSGV